MVGVLFGPGPTIILIHHLFSRKGCRFKMSNLKRSVPKRTTRGVKKAKRVRNLAKNNGKFVKHPKRNHYYARDDRRPSFPPKMGDDIMELFNTIHNFYVTLFMVVR